MPARRLALLGAILAFALSSCVTAPRVSPPQTTNLEGRPVAGPAAAYPQPEPLALPPPTASGFSKLKGWVEEDHVAAFKALLSSCPVQRDPAMRRVCEAARLTDGPDETRARHFFEQHFVLDPVVGVGLLTGYFTPVYEARTQKVGPFLGALRPRPADLSVGNGAFSYPDRAQIEVTPERHPLAWLRPEDLFFLQIQGSGILRFPDGREVRAVYDGSNGAPFLGIAGPMIERGLLPARAASAREVHDWLAAHRGPEATALMDLNRRYVFFRLAPDRGQGAIGAAGAPLIAGRSIAVDPRSHPLGTLFWLDAEAPGLEGAFPSYRRLALALDVGSAIQGDVRADLYLGEGEPAGDEAGRVRHVLRLYELRPTPEISP